MIMLPENSNNALKAINSRIVSMETGLPGCADRAVETSRLYEQATDHMADPYERRFFLTHAWVWALESGDENQIVRLELELRKLGGL